MIFIMFVVLRDCSSGCDVLRQSPVVCCVLTGGLCVCTGGRSLPEAMQGCRLGASERYNNRSYTLNALYTVI